MLTNILPLIALAGAQVTLSPTTLSTEIIIGSSSPPSTPSSASSSPSTPSTLPTILRATSSGPGCPSSSNFNLPSSTKLDHLAFSIPELQIQSSVIQNRTKNCELHLEYSPPSTGTQFALSSVLLSGIDYELSPGDDAGLKLMVQSYFSEYAEDTATVEVDFPYEGIRELEVEIDEGDRVWSACGTEGIFNVNLRVAFTGTLEGESEFGFDGGVTEQFGFVVRECEVDGPGDDVTETVTDAVPTETETDDGMTTETISDVIISATETASDVMISGTVVSDIIISASETPSSLTLVVTDEPPTATSDGVEPTETAEDGDDDEEDEECLVDDEDEEDEEEEEDEDEEEEDEECLVDDEEEDEDEGEDEEDEEEEEEEEEEQCIVDDGEDEEEDP